MTIESVVLTIGALVVGMVAGLGLQRGISRLLERRRRRPGKAEAEPRRRAGASAAGGPVKRRPARTRPASGKRGRRR